MERSDTSLVERSQRGDHAAFRKLYERYQRKVFSLAFGMVHNKEDALEIAQEAFLKAHRNLGRFQGSSSFYTWLYRIAVNVSIDFLRKEKKAGEPLDYDDSMAHHDDVIKGEFPLVSTVGIETPARVQSRHELADQIQRAVDALSEKHRQVILLREIQGLSYAEIAETLQIKKGTVMSRLHHARQNLQKMLRPYVEKGQATNPLAGPED